MPQMPEYIRSKGNCRKGRNVYVSLLAKRIPSTVPVKIMSKRRIALLIGTVVGLIAIVAWVAEIDLVFEESAEEQEPAQKSLVIEESSSQQQPIQK